MGSVRARAGMVSNSASAARHSRRATWHRPNLYLSVASSTWGWARGSGVDAAGVSPPRAGVTGAPGVPGAGVVGTTRREWRPRRRRRGRGPGG